MRRCALALALAGTGCGGDPPPAVATGPLEGAPLDGPRAAPPVPAPASAPVPAPEAAPAPDAGPITLDFARLARWPVTTKRLPEVLPPVPDTIRALDGRAVVMAGYVVPDSSGDGGRIRTALFVKHMLLCCFGSLPKLNEYVDLEITPETVIDFTQYRPARVEGTFLVGPHSTGLISHALYRIRVTRIVRAPDYPD